MMVTGFLLCTTMSKVDLGEQFSVRLAVSVNNRIFYASGWCRTLWAQDLYLETSDMYFDQPLANRIVVENRISSNTGWWRMAVPYILDLQK